MAALAWFCSGFTRFLLCVLYRFYWVRITRCLKEPLCHQNRAVLDPRVPAGESTAGRMREGGQLEPAGITD